MPGHRKRYAGGKAQRRSDGLHALRGRGAGAGGGPRARLDGDIAEGLNTVDVSVKTVSVMHSVTMQDFKKWLNRKGGTPKEITQRNHIRRILGIPEDCQP